MKKDNARTKTSGTIRLYQWFISTIITYGHISFSQLGEIWETDRIGEGYPLSRTTFNRYRNDIKELYGLEILCKTKGKNKNMYYIRNKADLHEDSPLLWSVNSMAIHALLYKHDSIRSRISIDQFFNVEHLEVIMEAIEKHNVLLASSWDYVKNKLMSVRINPYGLVLRQNEWFIISITEGEHPSTCVEMLSMNGEPVYQYYMVSGFMKVENTGEKFIQNKYFKLHKAISMTPELRNYKREESKRKIILMANDTALAKILAQSHFYYSYEKDGNEKTKVTLYTFGANEVVDFILSLGPDVQVIEPSEMYEYVREKIFSMYHEYDGIV